MTVRLSPSPGNESMLRSHLATLLARLPERPGLTGAAHLLRTETPKLAETTEQRIRKGDAAADWILLISGYSADTLALTERTELSSASLVAAGSHNKQVVAHYRLSHSLAGSDLVAPMIM
jgi:hypothetical protein